MRSHFICCGAFSRVDELVRQRSNSVYPAQRMASATQSVLQWNAATLVVAAHMVLAERRRGEARDVTVYPRARHVSAHCFRCTQACDTPRARRRSVAYGATAFEVVSHTITIFGAWVVAPDAAPDVAREE